MTVVRGPSSVAAGGAAGTDQSTPRPLQPLRSPAVAAGSTAAPLAIDRITTEVVRALDAAHRLARADGKAIAMALEKALIVKRDSGERLLTVMFNPEEYTVNRDNNFAQIAIPGRRAPLLQFVHGNAQTLDMELVIDTVEAHEAGSQRLNEAATMCGRWSPGSSGCWISTARRTRRPCCGLCGRLSRSPAC
jgi:hypothetical protein